MNPYYAISMCMLQALHSTFKLLFIHKIYIRPPPPSNVHGSNMKHETSGIRHLSLMLSLTSCYRYGVCMYVIILRAYPYMGPLSTTGND